MILPFFSTRRSIRRVTISVWSAVACVVVYSACSFFSMAALLWALAAKGIPKRATVINEPERVVMRYETIHPIVRACSLAKMRLRDSIHRARFSFKPSLHPRRRQESTQISIRREFICKISSGPAWRIHPDRSLDRDIKILRAWVSAQSKGQQRRVAGGTFEHHDIELIQAHFAPGAEFRHMR